MEPRPRAHPCTYPNLVTEVEVVDGYECDFRYCERWQSDALFGPLSRLPTISTFPPVWSSRRSVNACASLLLNVYVLLHAAIPLLASVYSSEVPREVSAQLV